MKHAVIFHCMSLTRLSRQRERETDGEREREQQRERQWTVCLPVRTVMTYEVDLYAQRRLRQPAHLPRGHLVRRLTFWRYIYNSHARRGNNRRRDPRSGNRFRSRFVFVQVCERAGEAKLRGRVREVLLNAGASDGKKYSGLGWPTVFAAMCMFS